MCCASMHAVEILDLYGFSEAHTVVCAFSEAHTVVCAWESIDGWFRFLIATGR